MKRSRLKRFKIFYQGDFDIRKDKWLEEIKLIKAKSFDDVHKKYGHLGLNRVELLKNISRR